MLSNIIGEIVGDVIKSVVDSDNNREVAIRESNNRRNVDITRTIVEGLTDAYRTYGNIKQAESENMARMQYVNSFANEIEAPISDVPMIGTSAPVWNVDYNTVWVNRSIGEMGADIVEANSGERSQVRYRIKSIGNKVHQVYVYVNNNWQQVGTVDWKRMSMADLGGDDTGGPIFAEIARIAMGKR